MNIPTYQSFVSSTVREGRLTRGTNITPVDNALKAYWANHTTPQKVALLIELIRACATWFKRKQGKKDTNFLGIFNDLFIKRKTTIESLGKAALEELDRELMWGYAPTAQERFAIEFHKKKLNTLTKEPTLVKPMERGYQPERSTYLASGKTTAISGTGVHGVYNDIHKGGEATRQLYPRQQSAAVKQALGKKELNLLTDSDFRALDEYASRCTDASMYTRVIYTEKEDRKHLMVFVDGAGLLCDINNALITTNGPVLYAMDHYGNLFCERLTLAGRGLIYNHSSFNAGNDVICAGTIQITTGKLVSIDNLSGHYQPDRENLRRCVEVLKDEGVNLGDTLINVAYKNAQGALSVDTYNEITFLPNAGRARR